MIAHYLKGEGNLKLFLSMRLSEILPNCGGNQVIVITAMNTLRGRAEKPCMNNDKNINEPLLMN